jgi:hypothetical protein
MTSRQYHAIDENVAAEIKRLHKRHPKLGHDGLIDALRQEGIHVDPHDLKVFMNEHRLKPERFWRGLSWRGAPSWLIPWGAQGGSHGAGFSDGNGGDDCD